LHFNIDFSQQQIVRSVNCSTPRPDLLQSAKRVRESTSRDPQSPLDSDRTLQRHDWFLLLNYVAFT
jgi:hypothetical protein